jgi:ABC-type sugar transport system ATPase subunit
VGEEKMPLAIKNLTKSFGDKVIFENFNYIFSDNGIYVLVGNSGRGKTTLLRMIAGLDKNFSGEITKVQAAYAFQEYRLFPALNALENITKILLHHSERQLK